MQTRNTKDTAVFDLLENEVRFKRFGEFLKAAGLDERLAVGRKITLFAPTNEAFGRVPQERLLTMLKPENREQLREQMLVHVVPDALDIDDLKNTQTLKTEAGTVIKVAVSDDLKQIKLANANVVLPKEEARDGVIYQLDAVLQPGKIAATA